MTEQITNIPDKGNKKRIVIVGGGFGGLKIARKLKDNTTKLCYWIKTTTIFSSRYFTK